MDAKKEDLESIYDIGEVVALSIYSFFKNDNNINLINKLFKNGVDIVYEKKEERLKGLTFVLTGTLSQIARDEAKEIIRKLGGDISSNVSINTDYVIVGENPWI